MNSKISKSHKKEKSVVKDWNSAIDSALMGMVMMNTGLVLLDNHRVIMRRDHSTAMRGKVKILGGGGAGLEPSEIGYVAPGMLTAAVIGDLFTSPKASTILVAIRELAHDHPDGVLVLIKNYGGDRLNFGLALEKANEEKITIKMLVIGDDGAEWKPGKNGRKGLAGSVFVYKIAGAMAEAGKGLDDIFTACRDFCVTDLSTVGMTLTPCRYLSLKPVEPLVKDDEMVLGMGLHGQSGVKEMKVSTANDAVRSIIDTMTHPSAVAKISFDECPVAVLINNLGSLSKLEEYIVAMEVMKQLTARDVKVRRQYMGTFMPSLDSQGFSISILKLTCADTVKFLDAPTDAIAWCKSYIARDPKPPEVQFNPTTPTILQHDQIDSKKFENDPLGPTLTEHGTLALDQIASFAAEAIMSCERQLNIMDAELGDGDTGTMLRKGAEALKIALREGRINLTHPYLFLQGTSDLISKNVGGTIGPLYCVFFSAAAKVFQYAHKISHEEWCQAFRAGVKAVKHYGKAELGDRTMLDALVPAVDDLDAAINRDVNPTEAIYIAAASCEFAAEKTKMMMPQIGRASRPKKPVLNPDPGAHAVAIWLRAVSEAFYPDFPTPKLGIVLWKFLNEEETIYVLRKELSKRDILLFLDEKLETEDQVLQTLLYQTIKYCRTNYPRDPARSSVLVGLMFFTHVYFVASRWRTAGDTYEYFREGILRHCIERPPIATEIFSPEEVRAALLFFYETYLRSLPLTRLLCVPHYKLRLEVEKEGPPPPPEPEPPAKSSKKK